MSICLNMIVKDEAANIVRCLESVAPHIDCYVICDTGSTDDTVNLIRETMSRYGIPGRIAEIPFTNFSATRNHALRMARNSRHTFDYLLLCDADMELHTDGPLPELTEPAYSVLQRTVDGLEYPNIRLIHHGTPATYRGSTHEYLDLGGTPRPTLPGVWFLDHATGGNREGKAQRDIALLLPTATTDPRSCFYLANTYYDTGQTLEAGCWYNERLTMTGYREEEFYSSYRLGSCLLQQERTDHAVAQLLDTFEVYPHRAEPLHTLAMHYQREESWHLSLMMAEAGSRIPQPVDGLFVESEVYQWRLLDAWAVAAWWCGDRALAADLNQRLLDLVPATESDRINANLEHATT